MPKKLLLADDSVVIQKLVGLSFANEDVEIVATDNGDDAVVKARDVKPDLVLADVVMPGMSGYEVCEAVKQDPQLSHIPVLLLTGTFEAFDEERARNAGADGHITKPFEAQALVERVKTLFATAAAPPAAAAAPGPAAASRVGADTTDSGFDFFDDGLDEESATTPTALPAARAQAEPTVVAQAPSNDDLFSFGDEAPLSASADLGPVGADLSDEARSSAPEYTGRDETVAIMPEAPRSNAPVIGGGPSNSLSFDSIDVPSTPAAFDAEATIVSGIDLDPPARPPGGTPIDLDADDDLAAPPPRTPRARIEVETTLVADDFFGDANSTDDLGDFDLEPPAGAPATRAPVDPGEATVIGGLEEDFLATPPADDATVVAMPTARPAAATAEETIVADPVSEAEAFLDNPSFEATPLDLDDEDPLLPDADPVSDSSDLDLEFEPTAAKPATATPVSADVASAFDVSSSDLGDPLSMGPDDLVGGASSSKPAAAAKPKGVDTAVDFDSGARAQASGAPGGRPNLSPMMEQRIHETLEKVAWEAFSDLSEGIVKQVLARVEAIAWEVIPQMAEALIQEEIRKMKGEGES